ncbi:MAG: hemerythrin family protein [Chlorobi bacterium]|nr:hemerythrin family protein [Chlorobiota bacterium]
MGKLVWDESYSVGVKALDKQHRLVFDMLNELMERKDITVRSEPLTAALTELTAYAAKHFKTEEQLMKEYGYPALAEHVKKHMQFRMKIIELSNDTLYHKETVPVELFAFLRQWWSNHILEEDMQYRPFFEEKGLE